MDELSDEYIQIVDEAPLGNYNRNYRAILSSEEIREFILFLADQEIYEFTPGLGAPDTGILYGLSIYIGAKVAAFSGDLLSGTNGISSSVSEGVNKPLLDYLTDVLIPEIQLNGTLISRAEFNEEVIENMEGYPFVAIYDRDNPDNLLSGDLSLWQSE